MRDKEIEASNIDANGELLVEIYL